MFHTVAWFEAVAATATETMTPITDQIIAIKNTRFFPTKNYDLLYAYAGGPNLARARILTPSLRQVSSPWISPIGATTEPGNDPNVADYRSNPLVLRGLEEVEVEATDAATGDDVYCVQGWGQGMQPAPAGDVYTMRGTGTTTAVAATWTTIALTWDNQLPVGRYALVGGHFESITGVAWRTIFEDQIPRPGGLAVDSGAERTAAMFRKGGLGIWGTFDSNRMPEFEVLCTAADTAQTLLIDFVRTG